MGTTEVAQEEDEPQGRGLVNRVQGGNDPGGRSGAGATESRGGAEGMKEPDGARGTKG